jgi:hypothetical protein
MKTGEWENGKVRGVIHYTFSPAHFLAFFFPLCNTFPKNYFLCFLFRKGMGDSTQQYNPGNCNIGQKEVKVRKKFFYFFLALTVLLTLCSGSMCESLAVWIGLVVSSFAAIVLYLEVRFRFCILFGFFNLYNFRKLGNIDEVKDKSHCKKDRRRVLEIFLQSLIVSLAYCVLVHMVGMWYHF